MAKTGETEVKRLIPDIVKQAQKDGRVGKSVFTSELRPLFDDYYNPTDEDKEILAGRKDDKLSQVIRNIPAHQSEKVKIYPEGFKLTKPDKEAVFSFEDDEDLQSTATAGDELVFNTSLVTEFPHNNIVFGAPGTGKSFTLNENKDKLLSRGGEYERVTFHEDYSYAHFVGTYKPTMIDVIERSASEKSILSVLGNKSLTAQEKYDLLYERFKDGENGLTRLPILVGLYSDEDFNTKKLDGTLGNNSVERNHGRAIRPFVDLVNEESSTHEISYEYVPGPFMRMYVKALKNARTDNPKPYLLIIEEINRATVARVFGDVFQLLDRDADGVSEYPIEASEDIKKYLAKELGGKPEDYRKIKIPNNMFLWATMNSADQGVKPMDTAFKRRWDFDYLGIDDGEDKIIGKTVELGKNGDKRIVEWNSLRKAINNELVSYKLNEDKLLGPFFLTLKVLGKEKTIDPVKFQNAFKSKILMYLFEDAAKAKRKSLFIGAGDEYNRYSSVVKAFDEKGIFLFGPSIYEELDKHAPEGE